jgi:dihydrofolate reductase
MRVVVSEFVTLDGVMEDPGGAEGFAHGGWAFQYERGADGDRFKLDELMDAEALLLGRVTYEGFAEAWPSRTDDVGFADRMNGMPKYVVSNTLETAGWNNSTVISGDVEAALVQLRDRPGGDLLVAGSATLVHTLARLDLVDEYRLMMFPTVLGGGKRLFPEGAASSRLELIELRPTGSVGILRLRPVRDAPRS